MYEAFYGLREKPFSIQPDPDFLFWGRAHSMAYAMLEYGIMNHAGFTVITGEVGCGKTTLIRQLLNQMDENITLGLISNTLEDRDDLLQWVLMAFGQPFDTTSYVVLYDRLHKFLIGEYSSGRRTILIVDEAQNLGLKSLEELRMLSNINADKDQLLQLVLVGQPQLKELLQGRNMMQFSQRIASDFHLNPLSAEEVESYVHHRLEIAGAEKQIFSREACSKIAEASMGIPRLINIICDTALVYGFSSSAPLVTEAVIEEVVKDKAEYGIFSFAALKPEEKPAKPEVSEESKGPKLVVEESSDQSPDTAMTIPSPFKGPD